MKMLTTQQIFNKSAKHMLKQNGKAVGETGVCRMYTKAGLRCAVGCLIPAKEYQADKELWANIQGAGGAFDKMLLKYGVDVLNPDVSDLLFKLQAIHDVHNPGLWHKKLTSFAKNNALSLEALA